MAFVGSIRVPSDKSISHRAVLFAGLAQGVSHLEAVLPSADVHATIDAMRLLGAHVDLVPGPHGLTGTVEGIGCARGSGTVTHGACVTVPDPLAHPLMIDCGNSGTTARLLMGVLAGLGIDATLTGDSSLSMRPMQRVIEPLSELGACFESDNGHLPVHVIPAGLLHGAHITTRQASAQVKSAVLLAGMQAQGVTSVTEPSKSRDHTELLLPAFGVAVEVDGLTARVEGPASLRAHDMSVPGDPSSAAFIAVAAALCPGSDVVLEQVALNPTRSGAFEVLRRMGARLSYENERMEGSEPVGDVHVAYTPALVATRVTPDEIPTLIDEIPILAVAAALAGGETVFESCGELRVKESDRMAAIIEGLDAFGVTAFADGDDLHVVGTNGSRESTAQHASLVTHGDHRLAMTWYLAGEAFGVDVELDDSDCVCVSWPDFFADMESLQRRGATLPLTLDD
ncbi:MAG: 3-phosphoshikimate 1-carboxyvinyltransferase [Coriobacteriales bacterium]